MVPNDHQRLREDPGTWVVIPAKGIQCLPGDWKALGNSPHPAARPAGHRLRRCSLRHPASAVRISLRDSGI